MSIATVPYWSSTKRIRTYPRIINQCCREFSRFRLNRHSSSEKKVKNCKRFMDRPNDAQTDRQTPDKNGIKKAHLNFKLRWANKRTVIDQKTTWFRLTKVIKNWTHLLIFSIVFMINTIYMAIITTIIKYGVALKYSCI